MKWYHNYVGKLIGSDFVLPSGSQLHYPWLIMKSFHSLIFRCISLGLHRLSFCIGSSDISDCCGGKKTPKMRRKTPWEKKRVEKCTEVSRLGRAGSEGLSLVQYWNRIEAPNWSFSCRFYVQVNSPCGDSCQNLGGAQGRVVHFVQACQGKENILANGQWCHFLRGISCIQWGKWMTETQNEAALAHGCTFGVSLRFAVRARFFCGGDIQLITPPKMNMSPEKGPFNWLKEINVIFQPSIFQWIC